jgi:hypothetical protein
LEEATRVQTEERVNEATNEALALLAFLGLYENIAYCKYTLTKEDGIHTIHLAKQYVGQAVLWFYLDSAHIYLTP